MESLPFELITYLTCFVKYVDLWSFFRVVKKYSKLTENPAFWRMRIEREYSEVDFLNLLPMQYKAKYFLLRANFLYKSSNDTPDMTKKANLYRKYGLEMIPTERKFLVLNLPENKTNSIIRKIRRTIISSHTLSGLTKLFGQYELAISNISEGTLLFLYQENEIDPLRCILYIHFENGIIYFDYDFSIMGNIDFPGKLATEFDECDEDIFRAYKLPDHLIRLIK